MLKEARTKGDCTKLDVGVLEKRINYPKLHAVFALHCLKFLADEVPSLATHRTFINNRFRTTLKTHRMRAGRKSKIHRMQAFDINEGTTAGQKKCH